MRWAIVGLVAAGCGNHDFVALTDGDWDAAGDAFGMEMSGVLTMDEGSCRFTLDDWSMEMLSLPAGGKVDGDQVTFEGDSFWRSCTGTVAADGASVSGSCQDGDDVSLTFSGT